MTNPRKPSKYEHVRKAEFRPGHTCHWPGCNTHVKPAFWGCSKHWYTLPRSLRDMIWGAYEPEQEITKTPSKLYLAVMEFVSAWIHDHYPETRKSLQ